MAVETKPTGDDLVVIASDPQELLQGHFATIGRVAEKVAAAQAERDQAAQLVDQCVAAGLNSNAGRDLLKRAESRLLFLRKVREALEAGYVLVPNIPGDTIAVRVKRQRPNGRVRSEKSSYSPPSVSLPPVQPEELPAGEGRYVDPAPFVQTDDYEEKEEGKTTVHHRRVWASAFDEEIGLPVAFLKPTVVQRTGMGMARKLFDEIAIVGNTWSRARARRTRLTVGRGDPMVLGRIIDPRNNRMLTFLIAWFVDTLDI